jgi:hypothetical protein
MSLEMAHKVILPPKKNYIPQFLKQRDINSYLALMTPHLSTEDFQFCSILFLKLSDLMFYSCCCKNIK